MGGRRPHCGSGTSGPGPGRRPRRHAFTVTGVTNKSLRALITGLLRRPYALNQACYDLARLRRNGLIQDVPGPTPTA